MEDLNLHKLSTNEDPQYIHKFVGLITLCNYAYRFYVFLMYNSMFIHTTFDISLVAVHGLLSISSLIFHIPKKRHSKLPMIYPEFRLHSIAFALRSVICCFLDFYGYPRLYKMVTCIGTMYFADQITRIYAEPGDTTMRAMPFSETTDEKSRKQITQFHSNQQVSATLYMLWTMESAFSPMFAIQIAAFLMTLVRKSIIRPNTWHLVYSWALMINIFIFNTFTISQTLIIFTSTYIFSYLRMKRRMNKYMAWMIVFALIHLTDFHLINDTQCTRMIQNGLIVIYLAKNIYKSRALYLR